MGAVTPIPAKPSGEASQPDAPAPEAVGNTLDQMMRTVVVGSEPLIQGYEINGRFCTLRINPRIWNSLSRGEQQQIGDILAASRAWAELDLVNARLFVFLTEVGRVKPNAWGGGKLFLLY